MVNSLSLKKIKDICKMLLAYTRNFITEEQKEEENSGSQNKKVEISEQLLKKEKLEVIVNKKGILINILVYLK